MKMKKILKVTYKKLAALLLILTMCAWTGGCSQLSDTGISYIDATTDVSSLSDATIDNIVKNVVGSMTLNEKVGQMFIVDVSALETSEKSVKAKKLSKTMKKNLELYPVGGIILFSREIQTPTQVKRFLNNMQSESQISLFVCVDEEGGSVSRIASNEKMKTTAFPSMFQIGQSQDTKKAYNVGKTIGKEIKQLGFNVDFAPVADVLEQDAEGLSSLAEIGNRSFGSDAKKVASMVKQVVKGLKKQKVCATLKHFPGQGAASSDTHVSMANVSKGIEELRKKEYLPFQSGIDAGAQFVMMSQEAVNSITGNNTPACMSSLIIQDILRGEMEYNGIVITDAMNMQSITKQYSASEAAVKCVRAGVDVVLMPEDLEEAYDGVIDAVKKGKIKESTIDTTVKRLIKCKIKQGILPLTSDVVLEASRESYDNYQDMKEQ